MISYPGRVERSTSHNAGYHEMWDSTILFSGWQRAGAKLKLFEDHSPKVRFLFLLVREEVELDRQARNLYYQVTVRFHSSFHFGRATAHFGRRPKSQRREREKRGFCQEMGENSPNVVAASPKCIPRRKGERFANSLKDHAVIRIPLDAQNPLPGLPREWV